MNNKFIINLVPGTTPLHKLSGTSKVRLFAVLIVYIMMSFDLRLILPLFLISIVALMTLKPNWKPIKVICWIVLLSNIFNLVFYYVVSPNLGVEWCNGSTVIYQFTPRLIVTVETMWYLVSRFFKLITSFMVSLVFILSITPAEFASGLYSMHVPYKICSIVEIAFRYIPDIARDYTAISISMQCRGVELDSKKTKLWDRLKQMVLILVPLVITSFDRVGNIANAMDLRGFGKGKKRSYYCEHEETKNDRICKVIYLAILAFIIFYVVYTHVNPADTKMWCPFN